MFYRFGFGRGIEFVCVDTSLDSDDREHHRFFQVPDHFAWLQEAFGRG